MKPLILASTSRYRRAMLERLGVEFGAVDPELDEDPLKAQGLPPKELVLTLAQQKAENLAERFPQALIVGGDQVAELDGEILHKPYTTPRAVEQLMRLSGRSHRLLSAVAVHEPSSGRTDSFVDVHTLTMRSLSAKQLQRYVDYDRPLDCAGSYKIESRGIALFSAIKGEDHTAIVGLPLLRLLSLLETFGWSPL